LDDSVLEEIIEDGEEEKKESHEHLESDSYPESLKKNYNRYSPFMKQEVVVSKLRYGIRYTNLKYQIPIGTIRSWLSKNGDYTDHSAENTRPIDKEFEDKFLNYIHHLRDKNLPVTSLMIQDKAKELRPINSFHASRGWLDRFLKRNRISRRKKTHTIQKLRSDYKSNTEQYFARLNELQALHGENLVFLNFDELPVYYDLAGDYTYNITGQKEVKMLSHTGKNYRTTVSLCISSEGEALPPLVIFVYRYTGKKTTELKNFRKKYGYLCKEIHPLMVRFNKTGFNNEQILNEYFDKIIVPYFLKKKRTMQKHFVWIMDDASFHHSESLAKKCKENDIDLLILPGGTTPILQPLDVVINKPFKDVLKENYRKWLITEFEEIKEENLTKTGNIRPPSIDRLMSLIKNANELMKKELIWTKTGITNLNIRPEIYEK